MACLPLRGPRGLRTRRPPSQGYTGPEPRATHHEGPDHDVGHLGQLIVQQRGGGVVRHLRTGTETAVRGRSRPHEAAGRTHAFQTTDELPSRERLPEGRTSKLKPERESRLAARPQGRGVQDAPASGDPAAWRSAWRGRGGGSGQRPSRGAAGGPASPPGGREGASPMGHILLRLHAGTLPSSGLGLSASFPPHSASFFVAM